ncbi:hypothetical protein [Flavobacterium hungaricum]|uniref:Uncharacterized protein n=1 Tax=Flavobacterium hungaricum TaxID=2082725 RepID=A0ABR9TMC4_9FLAO|nr:hypothetical protein [Flavobacterium hungaricum]MBE8726488.1 hypothetical protein [Flavobacterium hungaricum]
MSSKINCKVYSDNFAKVSFSDDDQDLKSIELNKFYAELNDFDIIIYNYLEGSDNYKFQRFFKTKFGIWNEVKIENGTKFETEIVIKNEMVLNHLNALEQKSFYQFCGNCYDCKYYTFLIKKDNVIFKYHSNDVPFFNIDDNEQEKLNNYKMIYNFFKEK